MREWLMRHCATLWFYVLILINSPVYFPFFKLFYSIFKGLFCQ